MKKQTIQAVIDYIEDNIHQKMTIDCIADELGYSRYYLYRLFHIITGLSIMDYLKTRRMQVARTELSNGMRILDMAIKYGYQSERSFRRAFCSVFSDPPSKLRQEHYQLPEKIHVEHEKGIAMISYLSDIKIVSIKPYYAIGTKVISKTPEDDSIAFMQVIKGRYDITPKGAIGSDSQISDQEHAKGLRGYAYYLVVDEKTFHRIDDQNLIKIVVSKADYLMLTIEDPFIDPFIRIPMGWKKLMQTFDESYQYRRDLALGCFEEVIETMTGTVMNLYIAI